MKKRILIIGQPNVRISQVISRLLEEGHEVIVASNEQSETSAKFMKLELNSFVSIKSFLKKFNQNYAYLDILFFQEHLISDKDVLTVDGYEEMMAVNYLAAVMITEGLKVSLKTEEHARIIYVNSTLSFKGNLRDMETFNSGMNGYADSLRALLLYTFYTSSKLKDDHVTVNMINDSIEKKGFINKLFQKSHDVYTSEDAYYLIMSDELRYKTSKLFNGQSVMAIPQERVSKKDIQHWMMETKKIIGF